MTALRAVMADDDAVSSSSFEIRKDVLVVAIVRSEKAFESRLVTIDVCLAKLQNLCFCSCWLISYLHVHI
jgi:hypothetical protein